MQEGSKVTGPRIRGDHGMYPSSLPRLLDFSPPTTTPPGGLVGALWAPAFPYALHPPLLCFSSSLEIPISQMGNWVGREVKESEPPPSPQALPSTTLLACQNPFLGRGCEGLRVTVGPDLGALCHAWWCILLIASLAGEMQNHFMSRTAGEAVLGQEVEPGCRGWETCQAPLCLLDFSQGQILQPCSAQGSGRGALVPLRMPRDTQVI